jgi:hypothetical protein
VLDRRRQGLVDATFSFQRPVAIEQSLKHWLMWKDATGNKLDQLDPNSHGRLTVRQRREATLVHVLIKECEKKKFMSGTFVFLDEVKKAVEGWLRGTESWPDEDNYFQ